MKRFLLFLSTFVFLANMVSVSAWAKPCVDMMQAPSAAADMPCHDNKAPKTPMKHCNGVCLCLHVSLHQVPVLEEGALLTVPSALFVSIAFEDEAVRPFSKAPPHRPPKFIS